MPTAPTWLEKLAERARTEVARRQKQRPLAMLSAMARAAPRPPPLERTLRRAEPPRLIAELKRRTPTEWLDRELEIGRTARECEAGGAAALCIATEPSLHGGSLDDLRRARAGCTLPILCRDVLVEPYQLAEVRLAGASSCWLHAQLLPGKALPTMLRSAAELGLEPVVELHTLAELERALDAGAAIVVPEPRDPQKHAVIEGRTVELVARAAAAGVLVVVADGDAPPDTAGVDAWLLGRGLMQAAERQAYLRQARSSAGRHSSGV